MTLLRVISGKNLLDLVEYRELVDVMEDCFRKYSGRETLTPSRTVMWIYGNWWGVMSSHVPEYGVGVKIVSVISSNRERSLPTIPGIAVYLDDETGLPKAVMDGAVLTGLRTAAASTVSLRYMKHCDGGVVTVIGAGYQARFHIRFISEEFDVKKIMIYDLYRPAAKKFFEYLSELGFKAEIADSLRDALERSDVIIEASTTSNPVVLGKYLSENVHIISIGAHTRDSRALDDDTIIDANLIVVDSREATYQETGDIYWPIEKKIINRDKIIELGEFLMDKNRFKSLAEGITIYKSVGIAVEDACASAFISRKADDKDVGVSVEL